MYQLSHLVRGSVETRTTAEVGLIFRNFSPIGLLQKANEIAVLLVENDDSDV